MPTRIHDSDTESSGLSNDLHEERVPTTLPKQMLVSVETPSRYDSDNDNNNGDETYYNIDTISKLNPKILRGMLIELTRLCSMFVVWECLAKAIPRYNGSMPVAAQVFVMLTVAQ
ncbi:uncharacterized protein UBRO_20240 [Ustilago bromivora]|uniref:Uncharacterized protein n=1 Tax=Ustilago bromivora TaxID=307758 RepID=A0A1K0GX29_9BASI|nr:uncharacterized protein UBRO_20240 [Ustilago bromivora]